MILNLLAKLATTIPEVKKLIRSVSLKDIEQLARNALDLSTADEVKTEIQNSVEQLLPNYADFKFFGMSP